jgi:lactoylglutathione lyase
VYVDDVDATVEALAARGAPVIAEPEDQPWGERVAQTRDPGGILVYLGAPRRRDDTLFR